MPSSFTFAFAFAFTFTFRFRFGLPLAWPTFQIFAFNTLPCARLHLVATDTICISMQRILFIFISNETKISCKAAALA